MDPEVLQLFVQEVDRQAQFGLSAAADLRHAVTRNDTDRVWWCVEFEDIALCVVGGDIHLMCRNR